MQYETNLGSSFLLTFLSGTLFGSTLLAMGFYITQDVSTINPFIVAIVLLASVLIGLLARNEYKQFGVSINE